MGMIRIYHGSKTRIIPKSFPKYSLIIFMILWRFQILFGSSNFVVRQNYWRLWFTISSYIRAMMLKLVGWIYWKSALLLQKVMKLFMCRLLCTLTVRKPLNGNSTICSVSKIPTLRWWSR